MGLSWRVVRHSALASTLALLSACGHGGSLGARPSPTVSCPSEQQIDDMESEELNHIPPECDENLPRPTDKPGVTVGYWTDPDGDSTVDSVTRFRTAPFTLTGSLAAADDADWFGIQWPGGVLQLALTEPSSGLFFAVTLPDAEPAPTYTHVPVNGRLALELPRGRYCVVIAATHHGPPPTLRYRISAAPGR